MMIMEGVSVDTLSFVLRKCKITIFQFLFTTA